MGWVNSRIENFPVRSYHQVRYFWNFFLNSLKITFSFRLFIRFEHFSNTNMFILTFLNIFGWKCGFLFYSDSSILNSQKWLWWFKYLKSTFLYRYQYTWIYLTAKHLNSWLKHSSTCYKNDSIFGFCWVISFSTCDDPI